MSAFPAAGLSSLIAMMVSLGPLVQLIVLSALCFASVRCWGVMIQKAILFRKARQHSERFLATLDAPNDLAFMAAAARRFVQSPFARMFRATHHYIETLDDGVWLTSGDDATGVSAAVTERLRYVIRQEQAEEIDRFEHGLPFLATTASVAPFVGLFGTVWGIMQSFHAIGQRGGASLAVVGPGISEALVVTAVGLATAIPAVVGYNHYLNRLRRLESDLDAFANHLLLLFDDIIPYNAHRPNDQASLQR
jgi:biopolymer transport protein TolQ